MMTKKEKLIWRLKEKPTAEGVASLVETNVITPEEGREILFNSDKKNQEELKEEIKFLRELVDTLAKKSNGYSYIYKEYIDYVPSFPRWYRKYEPIFYSYDDVKTTITSTAGSSGSTTNVNVGSYLDSGTAVNAMKTLSSLNNN